MDFQELEKQASKFNFNIKSFKVLQRANPKIANIRLIRYNEDLDSFEFVFKIYSEVKDENYFSRMFISREIMEIENIRNFCLIIGNELKDQEKYLLNKEN